MRSVRAILLAVIAALGLLAGIASSADANGGEATHPPTYGDPGDPGLPPY